MKKKAKGGRRKPKSAPEPDSQADEPEEEITTFHPPAPKMDPETELWFKLQDFSANEKDWVRRCVAGLKTPIEAAPVPTEPKELYCICAEEEDGLMIECDNEERCLGRQWYHLRCVGMKKAPRGDWNCPRCSTVDLRASAWAQYIDYLETRANGVDLALSGRLRSATPVLPTASQDEDTIGLPLGHELWLEKTFDPGRCKLRKQPGKKRRRALRNVASNGLQ